jgi:hypothetical protein
VQEDERRRAARQVEASNQKWEQALKAAQEVETLKAERKREYRKQLLQVNLGVGGGGCPVTCDSVS